MVFAIGRGGTKLLLRRARPLVPGNVYGSLLEYINKVGGVDLGRGQPAGKVWFRVHMVPVAWSVGLKAIPGKPGKPRLLPTPPGVDSYSISAPIRAKMLPPIFIQESGGSKIWPVVVGAAAVIVIVKTIKGR